MSFFDIFFKAKRNLKEGKGIAEHLDYINTLRTPAIALFKSDSNPFSKIGGLPNMPKDMIWPEWNGSPLAFLCQFDLSEIPKEYLQHGLPSAGLLYFFYDQEQGTWGFDPKDKGSWKVIYSNSPASECVLKEPPKGLKKDCVYKQKSIGFSLIETYPDWQDSRIEALDMTNKQSDEYAELQSSVFKNNPSHQMFGYPSPVQDNEMDLQSQLASNGIYCGDTLWLNDKRAKELGAGRDEWIMLLQLDTDDETAMMWGDIGMLYFWIKKSELELCNFDNCWMILQCC